MPTAYTNADTRPIQMRCKRSKGSFTARIADALTDVAVYGTVVRVGADRDSVTIVIEPYSPVNARLVRGMARDNKEWEVVL